MYPMDSNMQKKWSEIIAHAWRDEKFKKELFSNPREVLKKNGIDLPSSVEIHLKEGSGFTLNITIPHKPKDLESLGEDELKNLAAGGSCWPH